jgi:Syd protein.
MTSSNSLCANNNLPQALHQFAKLYIKNYQHCHNQLPKIEHDVQWVSPCEQGGIEKGDTKKIKAEKSVVSWQPVEITSADELSFENVESALALTLHPDIKTYFTTIYSEQLAAKTEDGDLSLLFAWNKDDFQRLQENIIGHILMKRRLKQAETVFFAVTDEDDMIISIDNDTGAVWVEQVGCKPHKKLSNSITEFITQLTPIV